MPTSRCIAPRVPSRSQPMRVRAQVFRDTQDRGGPRDRSRRHCTTCRCPGNRRNTRAQGSAQRDQRGAGSSDSARRGRTRDRVSSRVGVLRAHRGRRTRRQPRHRTCGIARQEAGHADEQEEGSGLVRLSAVGSVGFQPLCERCRGRSGAEDGSEAIGEAAIGHAGREIDIAEDSASPCQPARCWVAGRRPCDRYAIALMADLRRAVIRRAPCRTGGGSRATGSIVAVPGIRRPAHAPARAPNAPHRARRDRESDAGTTCHPRQ